jgi:N-methylhydantoinase A
VFFERHAEMRYKGQRHNIKVPITGLDTTPAIREAFERDYKRRYGHADSKAPGELQALHLSAFAKLRRPDIARLPRRAAQTSGEGRRPVIFAAADGPIHTPVYDRGALPIGFKAEGPAVIEEYGSTTLVWPGDRFEVGELGEIRIHCASK